MIIRSTAPEYVSDQCRAKRHLSFYVHLMRSSSCAVRCCRS